MPILEAIFYVTLQPSTHTYRGRKCQYTNDNFKFV